MREDSFVHEPFLDELERTGWQVIRLSRFAQKPADSYRESFADVVMGSVLASSLKTINPFLDDEQISECMGRLTSYSSRGLIDNNTRIFELLLKGASVAQNKLTGEKSPTVRYMDFATLSNNSFIAVSELGVKAKGVDDRFYPDITLFVNGLPIVVIEAKAPKAGKNVLEDAFADLQNYAELKSGKKKGNRELLF